MRARVLALRLSLLAQRVNGRGPVFYVSIASQWRF